MNNPRQEIAVAHKMAWWLPCCCRGDHFLPRVLSVLAMSTSLITYHSLCWNIVDASVEHLENISIVCVMFIDNLICLSMYDDCPVSCYLKFIEVMVENPVTHEARYQYFYHYCDNTFSCYYWFICELDNLIFSYINKCFSLFYQDRQVWQLSTTFCWFLVDHFDCIAYNVNGRYFKGFSSEYSRENTNLLTYYVNYFK